MEVKILDTYGKTIVERQYFPQKKSNNSQFLLGESEPGVYMVNIIIDGMVKTRKLRIR